MQAHGPSHPQQGALYYRILSYKSQKSVCCIWDNESRVTGDKAVINFAKDCDVMIHDTQYTSKEYNSDKMIVQGFGHSTYEMALDDAHYANVKQLYCIHYNPSHTDKILDEIQESLNFRFNEHVINNPNKIILAREGMEVEV
jgi:ribonuclease BN (tRNA processing enzyme)